MDDTEKRAIYEIFAVLVAIIGIGLLLLFIGGLIYFFQFEVYMTIWNWLAGLFLALFEPPVYKIFLKLGGIIAGVPVLIAAGFLYIMVFNNN